MALVSALPANLMSDKAPVPADLDLRMRHPKACVHRFRTPLFPISRQEPLRIGSVPAPNTHISQLSSLSDSDHEWTCLEPGWCYRTKLTASFASVLASNPIRIALLMGTRFQLQNSANRRR